MKHQRHFERTSDVALREAAQISTMISDLDRCVRLLDCDIAAEEERSRISDRSDSAYPILGRTLAARRDNLRDTIAALEQRLTTIKAPLVEAVAAQRPLTSIAVAECAHPGAGRKAWHPAAHTRGATIQLNEEFRCGAAQLC